MTANVYQIGNLLRLQASFYDENNTLADPTAVTLKVKTPDGTVTSYTYPATVQKSSTGIYTYDLPDTLHGRYYYRWEGTGAVVAAYERSFDVEESFILNT